MRWTFALPTDCAECTRASGSGPKSAAYLRVVGGSAFARCRRDASERRGRASDDRSLRGATETRAGVIIWRIVVVIVRSRFRAATRKRRAHAGTDGGRGRGGSSSRTARARSWCHARRPSRRTPATRASAARQMAARRCAGRSTCRARGPRSRAVRASARRRAAHACGGSGSSSDSLCSSSVGKGTRSLHATRGEILLFSSWTGATRESSRASTPFATGLLRPKRVAEGRAPPLRHVPAGEVRRRPRLVHAQQRRAAQRQGGRRWRRRISIIGCGARRAGPLLAEAA